MPIAQLFCYADCTSLLEGSLPCPNIPTQKFIDTDGKTVLIICDEHMGYLQTRLLNNKDAKDSQGKPFQPAPVPVGGPDPIPIASDTSTLIKGM